MKENGITNAKKKAFFDTVEKWFDNNFDVVVSKPTGYKTYTREIFVDYDEQLGGKQLKEISLADSPMEKADEIFMDWESNSADYYYGNDLEEVTEFLLKNGFSEEDFEEYKEDFNEWYIDHVSHFLPESVRNQEVKVCISLDTGDGNSDFTKCNLRNYYAPEAPKVEETCPLKVIAESQEKLPEMVAAIENKVKIRDCEDRFVKSVLQELEELPSHMATFTFLTKIPLSTFLYIRDLMKIKSDAKIEISKDSMCGLFSPWDGGGSVLEVALDKNVKIPVNVIKWCWIDERGGKPFEHGYGVDDVYGLVGSAYDASVTILED